MKTFFLLVSSVSSTLGLFALLLPTNPVKAFYIDPHAETMAETVPVFPTPLVQQQQPKPPPDSSTLEVYAKFAGELADAARLEIMPYWRRSRGELGQELKVEENRSVFQSASPVTLADRAAERKIRELIEESCPAHGIIGEEFGEQNIDADFVWVLDPIDGTRSFITGRPLFGTLISLLYRGSPVIGVIDQPVLDERWIGVVGRQSTFNGAPVRTEGVSKLQDAELFSTTPDMFKAGHEMDRYGALKEATRSSHFGADCYAYALLASGFGVDMVVEADLGLYDYCALVPIVEGAGGTITDWEGDELGLHNHDACEGRVLASANHGLHEQALRILKSNPPRYD
ncbi:hypothetical protein THAOC_02954 [Thalassiosira oceanica]|uniref:histidinol-phosphatase n=1 Tax=Thalassiosira oceanica TaxID=159749 RepID=K0TDV3_THAOC|nr:hypothetical protein THAOC_02954 [Thalassiosira oceanica]|eukprot:EJK75324.1 hypothetical protein THAOC_02954 [Thalassiosira oceanica]